MISQYNFLVELALTAEYAALALMTFIEIINGKNSVYGVLMLAFITTCIYHATVMFNPHPEPTSLGLLIRFSLMIANIYCFAIIRRYST